MRMTRIARRVGLDRNPLRRRSDRVEAWFTVLLAGVLLLAGPLLAWRAGQVAYRNEVRASTWERQNRFQVQAVLQNDAAGYVDLTDEAAPVQGAVPARWTAPDGTARTGSVVPPQDARAGSSVRVWTDIHGERTKPPRHRHPPTAAVANGLVTVVGISIGVAVLRLIVRRRLNIHRMAAWQMEWMLVEPRWSGRR